VRTIRPGADGRYQRAGMVDSGDLDADPALSRLFVTPFVKSRSHLPARGHILEAHSPRNEAGRLIWDRIVQVLFSLCGETVRTLQWPQSIRSRPSAAWPTR